MQIESLDAKYRVAKDNNGKSTGTGPSRELRRNGEIPCVIYGKNQPVLHISVNSRNTTLMYEKRFFTSKIINLSLGDKNLKVVAKNVEKHKVSGAIIHIDFTYLDQTHHKVAVPIHFTDREKAPGTKKGGFFCTVLRKIEILCPVESIPQYLTFDASNVYIGKKIKASDIVLPQGATFITKPETIIASVIGKVSKEDVQQTPAATTATKK